jgi:UDP-N-acetylglucosamine transferase subunit ALG13
VVFVTVGSAPQAFERLLKEVDRLAGNGMFGDEKVFVQAGHSKYTPAYCESEAFISRQTFQHFVKEASLVICHGGATPLEVIRAGKVPIVMPRRKQFGEIVNDHQVEFVQVLAQKGLVIPVMQPEDLAGAISRARQHGQQLRITASPMVGMVARSLDELCH